MNKGKHTYRKIQCGHHYHCFRVRKNQNRHGNAGFQYIEHGQEVIESLSPLFHHGLVKLDGEVSDALRHIDHRQIGCERGQQAADGVNAVVAHQKGAHQGNH